jgi:hypothetical protein
VVVATGAENRPLVPAPARALPARIAQCHTADYRAPGLLPDGAVLVVGSAQSGCQIAEDLLAGGRKVVLATSPVGRLPTPYRGRGTLEWLVEDGFFDQRPQDLPAPAAEPEPAAPVDLETPTALDLRAQGIGSVVWCTGFGGDFSWLDPSLLDGDGRPRRHGAAIAPGLWCLGLRWMLRRASNILYGLPGDAARVADAVRSHLAR